MTASFISAAVILALTSTYAQPENLSCASPKGYGIVRVHGRLAVYNGGYPNFRLWWVGTHHLFGIYGDPIDPRCQSGSACSGDEEAKLPGGLKSLFKGPDVFQYEVYGDFSLRLLEAYEPGHMQAACIISADHLVRRLSK